MDNRIFNVNGRTEEHLQAAIELAFAIDGTKKASFYKVSEIYGLIVYPWETEGAVKFLAPMSPKLLSQVAWEYLQNFPKCECEGWDADSDHDGDNVKGWRVYVGDWGHIEGQDAVCAIKPAFLWHGK